MRRLIGSILVGLLLAAALLGIAVATDGAIFNAHWIRDLFIAPPLWLLQTGLPAASSTFAIDRGSPNSGFALFTAYFIGFWWLVCSAVVHAVRRKLPNLSLQWTVSGVR